MLRAGELLAGAAGGVAGVRHGEHEPDRNRAAAPQPGGLPDERVREAAEVRVGWR